MAEPHNKPENAQHDDEVDRFDEAQPFLQLLANILSQMSGEPEADDAEEKVNEQEQAAG